MPQRGRGLVRGPPQRPFRNDGERRPLLLLKEGWMRSGRVVDDEPLCYAKASSINRHDLAAAAMEAFSIGLAAD